MEELLHELFIEFNISFLPEILGPRDIFMYNRASVHRAYIIQELLEYIGVPCGSHSIATIFSRSKSH